MAKEKHFNKFYFVGASLSLAGLILSHNALLIMFLPFIIFYAAYLVLNSINKKNLFIGFVSAFTIGVGLSLFFLYPAFSEGKYTLRDIVTAKEYASRFVRLDQLFYGPWSYGISGQFTVQVGIAQWMLVVSSLLFLPRLLRKDKKLLPLYLFAVVLFIGSLFLTIKGSDFIWRTVTTLQKFQFPWRFLSSAVFASAVLGGLFIYFIKNINIRRVILFLLVIGLLISTKDYAKAKEYLNKSESFYSGIYNSTTDTGESSPIWSVRFMEKRPKMHAEVIEGNAKIKEVLRKSTHHQYEIDAESESRIRENTLYFPGWKVYIDGTEYKDVQFQDPSSRGLITYYVLSGKHVVDIKFEETKIRAFSNYISLASLVIILAILFNAQRFLKIK